MTAYTTATTVIDITATTTVNVITTTTIDVTATDVIDITTTEITDVAVTSTADMVATTVEDVTATTDIDVTATITESVINTVFVPVTTVVDITAIQTDYTSTTITITSGYTLVERAIAASTTTIAPSSIPAYTSACSGSVRFSSACFCVGVIAKTTTLPSPLITVTVPYTYTVTTVTQTVILSTALTVITQNTKMIVTTISTAIDYIIDSTATALVTDATVTVFTVVSTELDYATTFINIFIITDSTVTAVTTDSTEIDFVTVNTAIITVIDSTLTDVVTSATITVLVIDTIQSNVAATVTQVAVSTVCANPTPTFAIKIANGVFNGEYLHSSFVSNQGVDYATAVSVIGPGSAYTLEGTVLVDSNGNILATPAGTAFTYAEFRPASTITSGPDLPFICTINTNQLTCSLGSITQLGICNIAGPTLVLTRPGYYPSGYGCTNVVLDVIPLCTIPT